MEEVFPNEQYMMIQIHIWVKDTKIVMTSTQV